MFIGNCFSFLLQVETYKSFRPGDIVLAKVVSFTLLWRIMPSLVVLNIYIIVDSEFIPQAETVYNKFFFFCF